MTGGPPAWIYLLTPLFSLLAVVLAYLLGNTQGRAQMRYDRQTEALTRILALALEAEDYLDTLRSFGPGGPVEEWTEAISHAVQKTEEAYRSSRPWLVPDQRRLVESVLAPFQAAETLLVSARDMGAALGASVDPDSHARILETFDVATPIGTLDGEVTRLASAPSMLERLWDVALNGVIRAPRLGGRQMGDTEADG